ncbi:hypothetical protein AVEN_136961-1 [Araneus ventricosus]|uniref:Uncharacterized protein n=1 Tax=Araneus ventricosus TaxID=182803 RepID=A0A4Y2BHG7_ARAVE|nr:hypothetical protein AVEN_136961-1 [Araneus ventricosus]
MKVLIAGGCQKSLLIHDNIMLPFMKDLLNTHELCQGSSVLDNIFTARRKVFSIGLRETKGFCHWGRLLRSGLDHLQHRKGFDRVNINRTCEDRSRTAHVL